MHLQSQRLKLRRWVDSDIEPFAAMNSDPAVMEFFPSTMSYQQTVSMVENIECGFDTHGLGLWAVELMATHEFIDFVGLNYPRFQTSFTPCVEVGWRLASPYWGNGYAPEAAREVIKDGFERLCLLEILSWTAVINRKSIRVMEKINMQRNTEDDFLHPSIADDSPLKPHVLYRLSQKDWLLNTRIS